MDQRPLRAGDSVDDYCSRERRVTSHAIVAVVDDVIRQTRCLTCDAEHEYKAAKMPRPRKKAPGLYDQVLANATGTPATTSVANGNAAADASFAAPAEPEHAATVAAEDGASEAPREDGAGVEDLWVGHRPLIRATLPRTEGDPPAIPRPIPEFTMHQRHGRGGHGFRQGQWQDRNGNGPDGFRHSNHGSGQGRGPQQPGPGGGRSRHRHRAKSRRSR